MSLEGIKLNSLKDKLSLQEAVDKKPLEKTKVEKVKVLKVEKKLGKQKK